jgi:hypothetical protein
LDGTYGQARRQRAYLEDALTVVHTEYLEKKKTESENFEIKNDNNSDPNRNLRLKTPLKLPVVKLDLELGGCDSAVAGMYIYV